MLGRQNRPIIGMTVQSAVQVDEMTNGWITHHMAAKPQRMPRVAAGSNAASECKTGPVIVSSNPAKV
jgi:hypothetical protein